MQTSIRCVSRFHYFRLLYLNLIFFSLAVVSEGGMHEYIDNLGKIWTFLCEVKDKEELFEVCRKNDTHRIISISNYKNSRPCLKKKSFQNTNGRCGCNCPFRLMFRPYPNANNDELLDAENSAHGAVFYRGKHVHATKMPPKKKTKRKENISKSLSLKFIVGDILTSVLEI